MPVLEFSITACKPSPRKYCKSSSSFQNFIFSLQAQIFEALKARFFSKLVHYDVLLIVHDVGIWIFYMLIGVEIPFVADNFGADYSFNASKN